MREALTKRYFEIIHSQSFDQDDLDYEMLGRHISLLSTIGQVESSSIILYDLAKKRYAYTTRKYAPIIGFDPELALDQGLDFYFDMVHADDLALLLSSSISVMEYLLGVSPQSRKRFKSSYDLRIKNADEVFTRILSQNTVLELDKKGNIWLILTINDPSPIGNLDIPMRRAFQDIKTGQYLLFPEEDRTIPSSLTPRQLEILNLIASGLDSRNIANLLHISVHTVNTHRRKILEDLDVRSSAEAVRYAADLGILD